VIVEELSKYNYKKQKLALKPIKYLQYKKRYENVYN